MRISARPAPRNIGGRRTLPIRLACALVALAAAPAAAVAATASVAGSDVRYVAGPEEANAVRAEPVEPSSFRIRD